MGDYGMFGRAAVCAALLALLAVFPCAAKQKPSTAGPFEGALFRTLFNDPATPFRLDDLNRKAIAALPDTLKARLATYAERYAAFHSRLTPPKTVAALAQTPANQIVYEKKQGMERAIIALTDSVGIEERATVYATQATIFHDEDTAHERFLAEALAAERWLDDPCLRPYLLLFLLHRFHCAYEFAIMGGDTHQAEVISQKYRSTLQLAREHPDPLVRLMAEDLDRYPKNIKEDPRFTGGNVHP